jgi:hypothetical protein
VKTDIWHKPILPGWGPYVRRCGALAFPALFIRIHPHDLVGAYSGVARAFGLPTLLWPLMLAIQLFAIVVPAVIIWRPPGPYSQAQGLLVTPGCLLVMLAFQAGDPTSPPGRAQSTALCVVVSLLIVLFLRWLDRWCERNLPVRGEASQPPPVPR